MKKGQIKKAIKKSIDAPKCHCGESIPCSKPKVKFNTKPQKQKRKVESSGSSGASDFAKFIYQSKFD